MDKRQYADADDVWTGDPNVQGLEQFCICPSMMDMDDDQDEAENADDIDSNHATDWGGSQGAEDEITEHERREEDGERDGEGDGDDLEETSMQWCNDIALRVDYLYEMAATAFSEEPSVDMFVDDLEEMTKILHKLRSHVIGLLALRSKHNQNAWQDGVIL